jgi:hypothetical protein
MTNAGNAGTITRSATHSPPPITHDNRIHPAANRPAQTILDATRAMPAPKRRRRTDIPESRQTARIDYEVGLAKAVNAACDRWLIQRGQKIETTDSNTFDQASDGIRRPPARSFRSFTYGKSDE